MLKSEQNNVLLSICIPTRERCEILFETLTSLYNNNYSLNRFEVIVYDTSSNLDTKNMISSNFNFSNLKYYKYENNGYLNLFECLKFGKGQFLKLHNDYSRFEENSIEKIVQFLEKHIIIKPVIFFSNGTLKVNGDLEFNSLNLLINKITYLCSWSTMFGIWKEDFEYILLSNEKVNDMFPHTSLMFQLSFKNKFILNDRSFVVNKQINNKGGYNIFKVFSDDFLNLLKSQKSKKIISHHTYNKIKRKLLIDFFVKWYSQTVILPNNYTFDNSKIKNSILLNYSIIEYLYLLVASHLRAFIIISKKFFRNLIDA
jgi:hypothetical protein